MARSSVHADKSARTIRVVNRAPEPHSATHSPAPDSPTDLPSPSWRQVGKNVFAEMGDDHVTDWAAALTYYAVLAIFPGALVLVAGLALLGDTATTQVVDTIGTVAPGEVRSFLDTVISTAQQQQTAAGAVAIVSLVIALWSASGFINGFMNASNVVYDVPEGRPIWKRLPVRLGVTIIVMLMLLASAAIVVLSGDIARQVGELIGVGDTVVTAWNILKWPLLLFIASTILAIMYYACPNAKPAGFRWVSPGGIFAVIIWAIASALFAFYVSSFASYSKTYGSLAGIIVFLVWLWISNIALLLGAEVNAELERARAVRAGLPKDHEPFTDIRDDRKLDDHERQQVERTRAALGDTDA